MSAFLLVVIAAVIVLVGIGVAATAIGRNARRGQQLVPGTESRVPTSWAGAHSPEARLHRRLVAAIDGARGVADGEPTHAGDLVVLQSEAERIETQLLAASRVPPRLRAEAVRDLEPAVEQLETIAAEIIGRSSQASLEHTQQALRDLSERLDLLDQARAELDEPEPGTA